VRPWEFLCAVGTRAGLLGNESGRMEAWVYPLKLLARFSFAVSHRRPRLSGGRSLARTLITRPESSTIVYTGDTFSVRETLLVPVNEPGALISLEVETEFPLEIEARFLRDFQLEWPASARRYLLLLGPGSARIHPRRGNQEVVAIVGSPTAAEERGEYQTNYSESAVNVVSTGRNG